MQLLLEGGCPLALALQGIKREGTPQEVFPAPCDKKQGGEPSDFGQESGYKRRDVER